MNAENNALEALKRLDYQLLGKRLLVHAICECRKYSWRGAGNTGGFLDADLSHLAQGISAADFVQQAVALTMEGRRPWDENKFPDITAHLKWVIKSLVSNLATSSDNTQVAELPETGDEDHTAEQPAPAAFRDMPEPESSALRDRLFQAVKDDGVLSRVLSLIEEEKNPEEIAGIMELSRKDVYQLTRKLRRRLAAVQAAGL